MSLKLYKKPNSCIWTKFPNKIRRSTALSIGEELFKIA